MSTSITEHSCGKNACESELFSAKLQHVFWTSGQGWFVFSWSGEWGYKYVMFGVSGCCTGSVHISLLLNIMDMQLHACSRKKTIFLRFG